MAEPAGSTETSIPESLQSLVVAFVLAMTFRGFVTEGFVIPTGSMAPTLMGQHVLVPSDQTGDVFPVGIKTDTLEVDLDDRGIPDAMLGPDYYVSRHAELDRRMGDRILVLKSLYPFLGPERFDVVVFKNPTDPDGKSANYIKRLIGLPDERIWLADGDVFAAPNEAGVTPEDYHVQRKPEHVQRAMWQKVHDSDFLPLRPDRFARPPTVPLGRGWTGWSGPPWRGEGWDTSGRIYRCATPEPTTLAWSPAVRAMNDWTSYNSLEAGGDGAAIPVSDIRVAAGIIAASPEALETTFRLEAREHVFEFLVHGGGPGGQATAEVRMRPADEPDAWVGSGPQPVTLASAGEVFDVDFWHVDQAMSLFINGRLVARHEYDWSGRERMLMATGLGDFERIRRQTIAPTPRPPKLAWHFSGSPVELSRVRTDRDIYYRPARLVRRYENPTQPGFEDVVAEGNPAFGTHPDYPAVLGPDHYFMLGDNSQASLDSRLWGNPHPLIAAQVDPHPFVVHRDLIIGKAWVVYFPAPYRLKDDGLPVVPDMGRLRFIR